MLKLVYYVIYFCSETHFESLQSGLVDKVAIRMTWSLIPSTYMVDSYPLDAGTLVQVHSQSV